MDARSNGDVAQLGRESTCLASRVESSDLFISFQKLLAFEKDGLIAQLVRRAWSVKREVGGSSPLKPIGLSN